MPVAASDIICFAAVNGGTTPLVLDTALSGGAIDLNYQATFTDLAADDDVEVLSDNAGDTTPKCTVYARQEDGSEDSEEVTLTGTTAVIFSTLGVVRSIVRIELDSDAAGDVTIRRSVAGTDIHVIRAGERGVTRLFRRSASEAGATQRYEKVFLKNEHATLALLNAAIDDTAGPSNFRFLLALSEDDSGTATNRETVPTGLSEPNFDNASKAVPGTDLGAGEAIGVWVQMDLTANEAAIENDYTLQVTGQTVA